MHGAARPTPPRVSVHVPYVPIEVRQEAAADTLVRPLRVLRSLLRAPQRSLGLRELLLFADDALTPMTRWGRVRRPYTCTYPYAGRHTHT